MTDPQHKGGWTPGMALHDIAAERCRQVEVEGWSPGHDDEHGDGCLAHAAASYALGFDGGTRPEVITDEGVPVCGRREIRVPAMWPRSWEAEWWKPKDRRTDLVRAGALIVAEIERLDRAAKASPDKSGGA